MEDEKIHYRHILIYYFCKGKNATQAYQKLFLVYGEKALSKRQYQNWFKKFNGGDFLVIDKQRSGHPIEICDNVINDIIDKDQHTTTRGIAEKLNVSHTCIEKRLQQMDYQKKLDLWIPHDLTETHLTYVTCFSSVIKMSPF